jgi:uronate dehydrogenase
MAVRVLVTGSSGHIGRIVVPALREEGYVVRGMDIIGTDDELDEFVKGDLQEFPSVRKAVSDVDLVIHLAGCSDDGAELHDLVGPNLLGVYHVLEAMRLEGVSRIIIASSVHAVDIISDRSAPWSACDRCPTTTYGLLKVTAEDMVSMFSRRYGISGFAARLGWVLRNDTELRELLDDPRLWNCFLSQVDLRNFFLCCARTRKDGLHVVYALSQQKPPATFDLVPAMETVGFVPRDTFMREMC